MKKINKTKALFGLGVLLIVGTVFTIVQIVSAAPTQPVHSVELISQNTSFANHEPGAWKITKWAGWSSKTTARVVFDIESVLKKKNEHDDVIFVVDSTTSMNNKIDLLKQTLKALADELLDDPESSIGLVSFEHQYEILSGFTNNKETINSAIDQMNYGGDLRDAYQGLNGAEVLLRSYSPSEGHGVTIVVIYAGTPNDEILFQKAQYRLIKSKYSYVDINAIQYTNSSSVSELISETSDNQFTANNTNIEDIVYSAAISAYYYDSFTIADYINTDYFEINPNSAPYTTNGDIEVDGDKVTLNISNNLRAGNKVQFEIDLKLKDGIESSDDRYPTNSKVEVASVLSNTPNENIISNDTPILKRRYFVTYNSNQPNDCEVTGVPTEQESYLVFSAVAISDTMPTCSGYNFAGYEIVTSNIRKMNDDYFWMPEKDVEIAATWTKVDIEKSMDGEIFDVTYLYDEIANKSVGESGGFNLDNNINFYNGPSSTNGQGVMTVASTASSEYPIHYYRGNKGDNHIRFGNSCWLIVRTTLKGGIKLLYNGEIINNQCDSTSSHLGYISRSTANVNNNYYYGTDYTFDGSKFSLAGEITVARYNGNNINEIKGKYTCLATSIDATCSILNLVDEVFNSASVYMIRLTNSGAKAESIGDFSYNSPIRSMSSVGYMENDDDDLYSYSNFAHSSGRGSTIVIKQASLSTSYWYADNYSYNSGSYELTDPYKVNSESDYSNLVGKYTFRDSSHDYSNNVVYYIAGVKGNTMYYLELLNGISKEDADISFAIGYDIVDNGDGTSSITNPFYVKKSEWLTMYQDLQGKFMCSTGGVSCTDPLYLLSTGTNTYAGFNSSDKIALGKSHNDLVLIDTIIIPFYVYKRDYQYYSDNGYIYSCGEVRANTVSTTCRASELILIRDASGTYLYTYVPNIYFASSATWDGSKYILGEDTIGLENYNNIDGLSTHHYFCTSYGQKSCTTVNFGYYHNGTELYYIKLSNGITTPEDVLAQSRANQKDSTIKNAIDRWYEHNLIDYTDKLEDAVYCNDRSIYSAGGWALNGRLDERLIFGAGGRHMISGMAPSLDCINPEDAFTVSEENGNGKLLYPIGLITADEVVMMGNGNTFNSLTWTMSPYYQKSSLTYDFTAKSGYRGSLTESTFYTTTISARPVITLKNGAFITGGDGTAASPWTVGWE